MAELLEQIFRACYSMSFSEGLNPAQWTALRYFGRANPRQRTAGAFAKFHLTTKGTASQTVAALVKKGYLARFPRSDDRRSVQLELTQAGRALLEHDPLGRLVDLLSDMPAERLYGLAETLEGVTQSLFANPAIIAAAVAEAKARNGAAAEADLEAEHA
ncbi:MAG TPA: MarR family transcriptional regulator [Alphaproteobacteria bacterium]|nr:MarR family transcriptional regulator [Alphaproteobacteria bacterium]